MQNLQILQDATRIWRSSRATKIDDENREVISKIFRGQRMFLAKMLTMGFGAIDALVQVPARKTNITCIAQVTFKMIHKGLLVNDWRLDFT